MADYHWLDDDEPANADDAEQYPDAVYDADDPEWQAILDEDSYADDGRADYDDSDWGDPAEWGWDDWPEEFDGEYYEVEIGIDYGGDE